MSSIKVTSYASDSFKPVATIVDTCLILWYRHRKLGMFKAPVAKQVVIKWVSFFRHCVKLAFLKLLFVLDEMHVSYWN